MLLKKLIQQEICEPAVPTVKINNVSNGKQTNNGAHEDK